MRGICAGLTGASGPAAHQPCVPPVAGEHAEGFDGRVLLRGLESPKGSTGATSVWATQRLATWGAYGCPFAPKRNSPRNFGNWRFLLSGPATRPMALLHLPAVFGHGSRRDQGRSLDISRCIGRILRNPFSRTRYPAFEVGRNAETNRPLAKCHRPVADSIGAGFGWGFSGISRRRVAANFPVEIGFAE